MATSARVYGSIGIISLILLAASCGSNESLITTSSGGTGQTSSPQGKGSSPSSNGSNSGNGGGITGVIISTEAVSKLSQTCGNGKQDDSEQCDDGNKQGGDGCTALCQIENEYSCPEWGKACISSVKCGDGKLGSTEKCDDGNTDSGDGCSSDCQNVEEGFQCRKPGARCVPLCGDGKITGTEKCDDGNSDSGDGCSNVCLIEPGYYCPDVGSSCKQAKCGNGTKEGDEGCDAGDKNGLFLGDGKGCSKTCTVEPNCRKEGKTQACSTACGDGNVDKDSNEECDDGNTSDADGCSSDCKKEDGFTCKDSETKDTTACSTGGGQCLVLPITFRDFDSQKESGGHPDFFYMGSGGTVCVPNASGRTQGTSGSCPGNDSTPLCLGLLANTLDGTTGKPTTGSVSTCKCQFTDWDKTGILSTATGGTKSTCVSGGSGDITTITGLDVKVMNSFKEWYTDSSKAKTFVDKLELAQVATSNQYKFSSSNGRSVYDDIHDIFCKKNTGTTPCPASPTATDLASGFFPAVMESNTAAAKVCNLWPYWSAASTCVGKQWDQRANSGAGSDVADVAGRKRNFYFTSEVRYLFRYAGGETLAFFGDDDVWVFLNGKLVLDLGAPHERLQGTVTLSNSGSSAKTEAQDVVSGNFVTVGSTQTVAMSALNLEVGKTYEIAVFHADRHPRESNYQLTVSGFSTTRTSCTPRCGDGTATAGEECDDGDNNKDSGDAYNACTKDCKYGPYCGDGETNGDEQCDNGIKNGAPYGEQDGCTNACEKVHYCGDGILDGAFGEECDSGDAGSQTCTKDCKIQWTNI